jgi:anthranilate phosphoribosyltransferase
VPNVGDLDEALIRPGRCFARVYVRNLNAAEAQALAAEIVDEDAHKLARASAALALENRKRSVAEVYAALR